MRIGNRSILIEGLDARQVQLLAERWGPFLEARPFSTPWARLQLLPAENRGWLEQERPGELYRLESLNDPAHRVVVSYNFAVCEGPIPGTWRVAINGRAAEPAGRIFDNVLRYLTARMALDLGGFALHGGGVLRAGRAYVFAGASGSGKSTAIGLSSPSTSLGDDMALILPGTRGWLAPALPFDNSERITVEPPRGLFPLAGIWRLYQAQDHAVERPQTSLAVASLLGCTSFPWVLPELDERLLQQVTRLVQDELFAHLHFRKDAQFWTILVQNAPALGD